MPGPLEGVRIVEIAGTGALPFAGMLLADMGAEVLRVGRADGDEPLGAGTVLDRGRRLLGVDLKDPDGVEVVLRLAERADALLEAFRPGVAERLGFGPDVCMARNPRLVYGRLTGFGQDGPLAEAPGHDINFLAITGALNAIGPREGPPSIPLNLLGDFAGGGMLLAFGVACALVERGSSGRGQVIDAAMIDGVSALGAVFHTYAGAGGWNEERESNMIDGAAHFYNVYACADGKHIAVGAVEPKFYAALVAALGLAGEQLPDQHDAAAWPAMRERLAAIFATKTRDEWCAALEGTDAIVSPVLTFSESHEHPHNVARQMFGRPPDEPQPVPAPRFDRTPASVAPPSAASLEDWGFSPQEVGSLRAKGTIR